MVVGAAALLAFAAVTALARSASAADAGPGQSCHHAGSSGSGEPNLRRALLVMSGTEGRGDGPAAANLKPRPRDFQNRRWQKSVSDAEIAKAIVYGGSSVGLSGEMAPNPDLETEPAIVAALVERVRKLAK